eukprot:scaffold133731_cov43-Prasinocladus_malaysianus.AAC.2
MASCFGNATTDSAVIADSILMYIGFVSVTDCPLGAHVSYCCSDPYAEAASGLWSNDMPGLRLCHHPHVKEF